VGTATFGTLQATACASRPTASDPSTSGLAAGSGAGKIATDGDVGSEHLVNGILNGIQYGGLQAYSERPEVDAITAMSAWAPSGRFA
jgi:hypothetical protein